MKSNTNELLSRNQAGFSLIELMVGMAVGLIGVLVIQQAFSLNEAYKRSTSGAGEAQTNGAIALYNLERDIRIAGYGMNDPAFLKCGSIYWYYQGKYSSPPGAAGPTALTTLRPAPVFIVDGGASGNDAINVIYSNNTMRTIPAKMVSDRDNNLTSNEAKRVDVDSNAGFAEDDLFVIAQTDPIDGKYKCAMYNVTPPQGGVPLLPSHLWNASGTDGPYNPPLASTLFPKPMANSQVFAMGQLSSNGYEVKDATLTMTPAITRSAPGQPPALGNTSFQLVGGIVGLKAWYVKDAGGGAVTYNKIAPTTAQEWQQVRAIRILLVSRSANYEKPRPESAGACDATSEKSISIRYYDPPSNSLTDSSPIYFPVPEGLPSCYRYRIFETVVPLRNIRWSLTKDLDWASP
jgi:type IV pilus assembly protein PilW